ncbi:hypothetical protein [Nostoc sp. 'Peltigera membranacea cyanobiont' 232]|uniref:hypothetical protein n=1 Tax=Nostoc sp. 'Peltigera membranacea cyanobiont' 232 TaxID=2014531 RepID=UPI0016727166|nr:hypothetical protein [Nostoc sp. 'Peltigera membranacea cyanobiont' 232]
MIATHPWVKTRFIASLQMVYLLHYFPKLVLLCCDFGDRICYIGDYICYIGDYICYFGDYICYFGDYICYFGDRISQRSNPKPLRFLNSLYSFILTIYYALIYSLSTG